jgi:signal peptide peptidase SppA
MNLIELLTSPWAIMPNKLDEIQAVYATHLRGDKIDISSVEAALGRPLASEQQVYQLRDGGVAHFAVEGTIAPKANLFTQISGGVSSQMTLKQINSMHADPRVRSVLIELDSPGGSVFGVSAVADAIRAMAADKPTVTLSTGMMASAGYWWGSAANAVYISGLTDFVGSIGVVATHNYQPRAAGGQKTEVTAGRYKRIASDTAPLTAEGQAYLQAQVDELYRVFVDAVAQSRNVSVQQVLEHMADGRVFVGQQAIDAGLVDGVSSVESLVEQLASTPAKFAQRRKAVFASGAAQKPAAAAVLADVMPPPQPPQTLAPTAATTTTTTTTTEGDPSMDRITLEREHATLFAELRSEFMAAGAASEIERIKAVRASALPGHEALIERLAFDGRTTGAEAAQAVLAAHREVLAAAGHQHQADAPPAAPTSAADLDQRTAGDDGKAPPATERKAGLLDRAYAAMNKRPTTA